MKANCEEVLKCVRGEGEGEGEKQESPLKSDTWQLVPKITSEVEKTKLKGNY